MPALITRCPACATMFKVVPDQLRVSEGWVRCGHCGEIFDAGAHMQPAEAVEQAQEPPSGTPPSPPAAAVQDPEEAALAAAAHEAQDEGGGALVDRPQAAPEPDAGPSSLSPDSLASSPVTEIDERLLQEEPDGLVLEAEQQAMQEHPLDRPFALRREDLAATGEPQTSGFPPENSPVEEPGFVRQARREARWQRPAVRAFLLLALVALAALLGLQVAVQERDRLAATEPVLRPWLARLCEPLGCRIAPPRRIEAIVIDGSTFNKVGPDAYRLQVTLKNQSGMDVAMPSIELTLTDSTEQPVVRRVLMPGELGASRAALQARAEWSGTVGLALSDSSLASRVAGYRVLAFYP